MDDCLFCKIIVGEIPSEKVFENDDMVIIKDINPQAAIHLLLLPKTHHANIGELAVGDADLLARCLRSLALMTDKLGLSKGYRLITNKGEHGCQSVNHIHIHIVGGEQLSERMC